METRTARGPHVGDEGVRGALLRIWGAVWRIGLYVIVFAAFAVVGMVMAQALGLPLGGLSLAGVAVSLLAALAAAWVMMWGVERRPFASLGFPLGPAAARESLVGTGIGMALLAATAALIAAAGGAVWGPDTGTVGGWLRFAAWTLVFFTVAAAVEEVLFRGYPFQVLEREVGPWAAAVATALVFALVHANNPNVRPLGLANIFLAGVLLAAAYLRTRSLWFATAVHMGWNWAMGTLLDLPVSGLEIDTPLYTGVSTGPDWWTGGSFGPEAGLAATLVLTAGTAWLVRTPHLRESPDVRRLGFLAETPSPGPSPQGGGEHGDVAVAGEDARA
ncbi:MAG TPA: CPBP family intramembrane glutamic endopeptidase [Longimicrobiaceae bacterium]|nr:CPBP family intramembrane glutamic endopeptidase [Longimicrobiaceae bacterium]